MIRVKGADLSLGLMVATWGWRAEMRTSGIRGDAALSQTGPRFLTLERISALVTVFTRLTQSNRRSGCIDPINGRCS